MNNIKEEMFTIVNGNTVLQVLEQYVTNSVIVKKITNTGDIILTSNELGAKYIIVTGTVVDGDVLKVTYLPVIEYPIDKLHLKLKEMDARIISLEEEVKMLTEAVNNRVNITSFQAWIALVEQKTGITLVDSITGLHSLGKVITL